MKVWSKRGWLAVGIGAGALLWGLSVPVATCAVGADGPWFELEAFLVEESARREAENLSPAMVPVSLLFGQSLGVEEVPRAVTLLTPAMLELLGMGGYEDLDRFGAGTQRINYFGLAGSAFVRGMRAGTYFNGMLRAYQRNEMPMSFGALEGMEIIKGPVPAGFSPTLVGGGVNQRPKSPFYADRYGEIGLGLGSWDEWTATLDYGAALLLAGRPAAYRVSYNHAAADRYYRNVPSGYDSLYTGLTVRLAERQRLFVAAEFYDYRSSEIPGINRPTAELIRTGEYVIGEPPELTGAAWGGRTVRPLLEFPLNLTVNPSLHALAVPGEVARQRIAPHLLDKMRDLRDPAVLASVYAVRDAAEIPPFAQGLRDAAQALLQQVDIRPQDAYLYTQDYFDAGGEALTVQLPRDRVLADPGDRANSRNFLLFAELESQLDPDSRLVSKLFLERLYTDKYSTYGFAFKTSQWVANFRSEWQRSYGSGRDHLAAGVDLRFSRAEVYQDFDAEPFSRRDLSRDWISANTIVAAGGMRGPNGLNFWSTFSTASTASDLWQAAAYAGGSKALGSRWTVHHGLRAELAYWETGLPDRVERASAEQRAARRASGTTFLYSAHLNPVLQLARGWWSYGTVQFSKAIAAGDGGSISGKANFTDAELFEIGLKTKLADGRFFSSLAAFHWDQSTYSSRDAYAQPLRARGLEWELSWAVQPHLTLLAAANWQQVFYRSDVLGFGAIPQDSTGWALNAGILNATGGRLAPNNPDMRVAGLPERTAHLYVVAQLSPAWRLMAGPLWRDGFYHDMQHALRIPGHVIWTAQLRFDAARWWASLRVENLFDHAYWIGHEPVFAAGTLILQGEPRSFHLRLGYRF